MYGKWEIEFSELEFEPRAPLGAGVQGIILPARFKNEQVACKIQYKDPAKPKFVFPFKREFDIMIKAGYHPNIVCLVGMAFSEDFGELLVLERCVKDLAGFLSLELRKQLDSQPSIRTQLLLDIAKGVQHLHSKDIIHSDLTSSNILIGENGSAKLSDFGLARTIDSSLMLTGNVFWAPREILPFKGTERIFSKAVDSHSFGTIIWETFTCLHPGYEFDGVEEYLAAMVDGYTLPFPSSCPEEWQELMLDCWNQNPLARPSFDQIVARIKQMEHACIPIPSLSLEGGTCRNNDGGYVD